MYNIYTSSRGGNEEVSGLSQSWKGQWGLWEAKHCRLCLGCGVREPEQGSPWGCGVVYSNIIKGPDVCFVGAVWRNQGAPDRRTARSDDSCPGDRWWRQLGWREKQVEIKGDIVRVWWQIYILGCERGRGSACAELNGRALTVLGALEEEQVWVENPKLTFALRVLWYILMGMLSR